MIDHLTRDRGRAVAGPSVRSRRCAGRPGAASYWGYQSIDFFAPHNEYSPSGDRGGHVDELDAMVKSLHTAGLEVILDVVFNHAAEGTERGRRCASTGLTTAPTTFWPRTAAATWTPRGPATRSTRTSLRVRDETRERATPKGKLLQPRDHAEAGYAQDLVGGGNRRHSKRAPELRGFRDRRGAHAAARRSSAAWLRSLRISQLSAKRATRL